MATPVDRLARVTDRVIDASRHGDLYGALASLMPLDRMPSIVVHDEQLAGKFVLAFPGARVLRDTDRADAIHLDVSMVERSEIIRQQSAAVVVVRFTSGTAQFLEASGYMTELGYALHGLFGVCHDISGALRSADAVFVASRSARDG